MALGAPTATILALLVAEVGPIERPDARTDGEALAALESEQAGLFARVAPSVVLLVGGGTSGSGFVVGRDGLVITNAHVVGQDDEVAVQLFDGRHGRGRVIARATGTLDLALVRVPFDDLTPLAAAPPALRAGMYAATVGHGGGAAWTFSTGLVSNPRPLGDGAPLVLAQMALRPGSSGGPLVDRQGRVVAIVTAGTRDASGVTFAIRADAAASAFPQLAGWGAAAQSPREPGSRPASTPEEVALVATPAPSDRVVGVSRFASGVTEGGVSGPAPAMVTVWERSPSGRRAAGRVPPRSASAPVSTVAPEATATSAATSPVAAAALATTPEAGRLPSLAALALVAGGAIAGAIAARLRRAQ